MWHVKWNNFAILKEIHVNYYYNALRYIYNCVPVWLAFLCTWRNERIIFFARTCCWPDSFVTFYGSWHLNCTRFDRYLQLQIGTYITSITSDSISRFVNLLFLGDIHLVANAFATDGSHFTNGFIDTWKKKIFIIITQWLACIFLDKLQAVILHLYVEK